MTIQKNRATRSKTKLELSVDISVTFCAILLILLAVLGFVGIDAMVVLLVMFWCASLLTQYYLRETVDFDED